MAESKIGVFVSQDGGRQISVLQMAADTGKLTSVQDVPVNGKVMPMAISPDQRFLYAALRSKPFAIASFALDRRTGMLSHLGDTPAPESTVNICTDRTGRFLLGAINQHSGGGTERANANIRTGMLSVHAIGEQGCLQSPYDMVRTPPKTHCIFTDPSNRHVFATSCDGDLILRHAFDAATGELSRNSLPPVMVQRHSGPRHFKFHPNKRFLYLVCEFDASVYAFRYDVRNAGLSEIQVTTSMPPGADTTQKAMAAELFFTPDGKWLYVSNRTHPSLAVFRVDPLTGLLTPAGHFPTAKEPRNFCIDPLGRYLISAGYRTDCLVVYRIDPETGALTKLNEYPTAKGPAWVECVMLG